MAKSKNYDFHPNQFVVYPSHGVGYTTNWVKFNLKYSELWPVIITKKDPPPDADERDGEIGKLEKYFSEKPGEGG